MDSFFEKLMAMPEKITHQYNNSLPSTGRMESPAVSTRRPQRVMGSGPQRVMGSGPQRVMGAGLRSRKGTRKSRFGEIPNAATVAYKQNDNSAQVLVNAATAKRLMVNRVDPIYHGGRRRTRKN